MVLGKFAEHGNEGAVGICITALFDREPREFHLFIRRNDVQTVGLKSSLKKGSLVFADLPEIAQCMLREEIGWHLHGQAFRFWFCCVRNSIALICQFGKKPFCSLMVGLVADFQITGLGNGVAFPDFVGTGGHELIYCRNADNLTDGFHQFLSILTVISNGHVKNSFLSAFLLSP